MVIDFTRIVSSFLLFSLVVGMSATVQVKSIRTQLHNVRAIATGVVLQFLFLPLVGFLTVKYIARLDYPTGIILLVVMSSPGGSYSNWWCSLLNADLALSVAMTAISTALSVVLLPINLLLYSRAAFGDGLLLHKLDWVSLVYTLCIVMCAIVLGLALSKRMNSPEFNISANRLGSCAGFILIVFSGIISNSSSNARIWDRGLSFYGGVALPCCVSLLSATCIALAQRLSKPEVVTIAIESCFQNVGIATSVSMAMFDGENLAQSAAVPFYYGIVQCLCALLYGTVAWKVGWTKAPCSASFWDMINTAYNVEPMKETGEIQGGNEEFVNIEHIDTPSDIHIVSA